MPRIGLVVRLAIKGIGALPDSVLSRAGAQHALRMTSELFSILN
jgi:hypothetical protein